MLVLPFPPIGKPAIKHTLQTDIVLGQWRIAKGTVVTLKQTQNFGWILLPANTHVPKRLFAI